MNEKRKILVEFANLIAINWVIIAFMNLKYPLIGHDFNLGIPSVLDSALHFRLNGLTIQWFTPSFGGGIPAFPNPNNVQFSPLVLLSTFLPPWQAMIIFLVLNISAGFLACEYFLRHTLNLNWTSSQLGAIFFSLNGFIIGRTAVGHLGYLTFPILTVFLILLMDRTLQAKTSIASMGMMIGMLIHFAGYFILIIFAFTIIIILPIIYIRDPALFDWKRFFTILGLGCMAGLLISLSKLAAVFSFMRLFPRTIADSYETSWIIGLFGLALQLLGTMNLVPLFSLAGLQPDTIPNYFLSATHADYGLWEMDMSVTPLVLIILLAGFVAFLHNPMVYLKQYLDGKKKFAFLFFLFTSWLVIEFILAKGLFYPSLRKLPILSSLHVNPRFTAALIFPLVFVAALIFDKWISGKTAKQHLVIFVTANIFALLPAFGYFMYKQDLYYRYYDIRQGQKVFEQMTKGEVPKVFEIGITMDNTDALLTGVSNLNLYEPAFGYELEYFHPQIVPGSIWQEKDGYLNMTNPVGYVFPEYDDTQPFIRFETKDKEIVKLFAKHIQPKWNLPTYQKILNTVSVLALIIAIFELGSQLISLMIAAYRERTHQC
jgi:hypothetical protein